MCAYMCAYFIFKPNFPGRCVCVCLQIEVLLDMHDIHDI